MKLPEGYTDFEEIICEVSRGLEEASDAGGDGVGLGENEARDIVEGWTDEKILEKWEEYCGEYHRHYLASKKSKERKEEMIAGMARGASTTSGDVGNTAPAINDDLSFWR